MQYMRMFFKFPNIPASINKCLNHKLPLANASGITCFELRLPCPKASQA